LLACIKITAVQLHPMLDCCGWLPGHCKVLQGDVWKLLHELSVVDGGVLGDCQVLRGCYWVLEGC